MNPGRVSLLIDVSRLVRRLKNGFLPTGIDRVILMYARHYGAQARAFVRAGRNHTILPERASRQLFECLLNNSSGCKPNSLRLLVAGFLSSIKPPDLNGAIFFNLSHNGLEDMRYIGLLRRMNVRPVFMVYDLIPITHPEYCRPGEREKHLLRMRTVLNHAHGVITISQATLHELAAFATHEGLEMPPAVPALLSTPGFAPVMAPPPVARPYFVILGTIEPRKNHLLLLQIWRRLVERMGERAPLLVIIGRIGWECESVMDMLERCEQLRRHVLVLSSCSDEELATWLRHSRALLFPSFAEGFGLPLIEALELGTPVIASNLPVFREIAGDIPDYLDPLDAIAWLNRIVEYTKSDGPARAGQIGRIAGFVAPTWDDHFRRVDSLLDRVRGHAA